MQPAYMRSSKYHFIAFSLTPKTLKLFGFSLSLRGEGYFLKARGALD
jgi:hypothetical protein